MKRTTMGSNLFTYLDRLWLKWDKLVGVKTDGWQSLTGENVGLLKQIWNKVTKKNQNWNYFWIAVHTVVCCISQIRKLAMLLMFKLKLGDKDKRSPSKLTCPWFRAAWSRNFKGKFQKQRGSLSSQPKLGTGSTLEGSVLLLEALGSTSLQSESKVLY